MYVKRNHRHLSSITLSKGELIKTSRFDGGPVYYEDTDFSGFVYHANYLKFCERAREHLIGIDKIRQSFERGLHFVVHELNITYKKPLSHGCEFFVLSSLYQSPRSPRIYFHQEIFFQKERTSEPLLAADVLLSVVFLDQSHSIQIIDARDFLSPNS